MKTALTLALTALALLASSAGAEEVSRESYTAAAEPICKANGRSSDRLLGGVSSLVKQGELQKASQNFSKAAVALDFARKQLAALPQPPADAAKLGKWLAGIKSEVGLMKRISAKLAAGEKGKATALSVQLTNNANKTNNQVIAFGFDYCRIDPSKYS